MIASRSLGFIFIKTRKTAGTSLEIVLSSWCSGRDICTPITPEDEEIRARYGGKARNYRDLLGRRRFYNHMPAAEVRARLPQLWERSHRFTVERHPYERVLSRAWFITMRTSGNPDEVGAGIDRVIADRSYLNHPVYTIDGALAVHEVWDYAEAWDRLRALAERLAMPLPDEWPRAKARFRKDRRPAREVLTDRQRERIYEDARFEFDLMGYAP